MSNELDGVIDALSRKASMLHYGRQSGKSQLTSELFGKLLEREAELAEIAELDKIEDTLDELGL